MSSPPNGSSFVKRRMSDSTSYEELSGYRVGVRIRRKFISAILTHSPSSQRWSLGRHHGRVCSEALWSVTTEAPVTQRCPIVRNSAFQEPWAMIHWRVTSVMTFVYDFKGPFEKSTTLHVFSPAGTLDSSQTDKLS